ncbi:ATP-binding protein [bacterium]|nr:ATP-binding protein [bacterium]
MINRRFTKDELHTIDLLSDREFYQYDTNPDLLINRANQLPGSIKWILIDEIQRVPRLLNVVHKLIEEKLINFALTGSSSRKLRRGGANLLAGRAFVYNLFPLTHVELGEQFNLDRVLSFGSLPKVFSLQTIEEKSLFLESYVHTYLKEEIVAEQLVRNLTPFRKFLQIAAQMNSQIINFSSIARDVGVDPNTVKTYFSILEETHTGMLLEASEKSVRKQQSQAPKFYLFDTGVKRALDNNINADVSPQTYEYGRLFETFLINEIHRLNYYFRRNYVLSYLRTKDDAEIDLILERKNEPPILIEIKSKDQINAIDTRSLDRFKDVFPKSRLLLLSLDSAAKRFGKVEALPWQMGLSELGLTKK